MTRADAIGAILDNLEANDLSLFTTGMISREAHAAFDRSSNFYMIGSMGLLSAIGLGLALNRPDRRVVVVEGDGSALMSLGTFPLVATEAPSNYTHVVLDNESYESTGNQPTISSRVDITRHAEASGYAAAVRATGLETFAQTFIQHRASSGTTFLLAKVGGRVSHDIARVEITPTELRDRFLGAVMDGRGKS